MTEGFVISAPQSGAGKTMLTLGILRVLKNRAVSVRSAKSGPDFIDPQFHAAALGAPCATLDSWAMSSAMLRAEARGQAGSNDLLIVEGAMGLYDGAPCTRSPFGRGSTADVAVELGLPVVLILDVANQGQTAAAVIKGLAAFHDDVTIGAVILNRVGSPRHAELITSALVASGFRVLGAVPRLRNLETPSRHLGLVQAHEREDLESFIEAAAEIVERHIDLDGLCACAGSLSVGGESIFLPPLGQRIAVARDDAFAFAYPHLLQSWRAAGVELTFFSPLEDQGPSPADAVYLPGGYPELYAAFLATCETFKTGMRRAAQTALVYGECGGYMALGRGLTLARGERHEMLGLLPVETSFEHPKLHLGYRELKPRAGCPWDRALMAHEFHYARETERAADVPPLFTARDSLGSDLGGMGARVGQIMGSFAHVICPKV